ncbi:MAG TPA: TonB-dependent receptor [Thermoanaerobaculia bacterium]
MKMRTEQDQRPGGSARRRTIALAIATSLALVALPALAADETAPAASEEEQAAAEEAGKLPSASDEIFVTARKKEENIQKVPVAVTVVAGETLEESAAADISELQTSVPNLAVYAGRNQSTTLTAFLRGIGQADPLWGVDPGVGLYLDDVYIARPQGALLDVYDVDRVEVLRGPQGTLYGKNTIGGAIKYVSRALTDERAGRIALTGGEHGTQEVRASFGGPLVEGKLRGKIAVASLEHDGYGTNLFTGRDVSDKDTLAYRAQLDWLASEDVKVSFWYDRTEDDAEPKGYQRLAPNQFCPLFLGQTCPPLDDRFDTQSGLAPLNGTDAEGYAATVDWRINDAWAFKSITARRESDSENNIDFDTTPARLVDVIAIYDDEQTSQELQFLYDGGGRVDGVFGVYYFDGEAGGLVKNIFLNGAAGFGTTNGRTFTESIAVFGEGSYALSDVLNLNLGLRVTQEEKNGVAFNAGYSDDTFTTPIVVLADYDKSETFDSVAPRIGLDYQFDPDVMGYVTLSRGFKSGGFNVRAQSNRFPESAEPFDDEVLDMAEVGVKSILAGGQLLLNAAVFYGEYTDIQVSTFTAFDANGDGIDDSFFGNFLNAGDATLEGVEAEFSWTPQAATWFGLQGYASYLDAEPDAFLDENNDGFVDTQVITNAPEWTAGTRANVNFPAFGGLVTASAGVAYRDDATLTNEGGQDPRPPAGRPLLPLGQPAYELWDAWINWLSPDSKWRVGLAGKNLTDEEYLTNGYNIPALGVVTGSYGAPRTVTATVEFRFF